MASPGEGFRTERARLAQGPLRGVASRASRAVKKVRGEQFYERNPTHNQGLICGLASHASLAAWAFGMQEVEVVGEQIWLLGAKAFAQNVQD